MSEEYQIQKINDYQYRICQHCLNPELGYVVLADFYGPKSKENAEIFLKKIQVIS